MDPAVEKRLKEGAAMLGDIWRSGERCSLGWGVKMTPFSEGDDYDKTVKGWACPCEQKTKFCKGKAHWFRLAFGDLRDPEEDDYGIPLMMMAEEWDLTKLTLKVEMKDIGALDIGPKGTLSMGDLLKQVSAPAGLQSTLRVLKRFPGSRVQGVQEPEPVPAGVADNDAAPEPKPEPPDAVSAA